MATSGAPSMAFPVSGHDSRAIKSGFGVPREAGRRTHHGVDIFAPRGTPVLAATGLAAQEAELSIDYEKYTLPNGLEFYVRTPRGVVPSQESVQDFETLSELEAAVSDLPTEGVLR